MILRRERASLEAARRGELEGPARGLDLDDWGNPVQLEEEASLESGTRREDMTGAERGLDLDDWGNAAQLEEQQQSAHDRQEPEQALRGAREPCAGGAVQLSRVAPAPSHENGGEHDGPRGGEEAAARLEDGRRAVRETAAVGSSNGGAAGGGGAAGKAGRGGQAGGAAGRASWLSQFLHHEPEKFVLHRRTNVGAMLLLAALLALFSALTALDRQRARQTRYEPCPLFA
jgi:hypothetical protein